LLDPSAAQRMIARAADLGERRPRASDPPRWILHGIALLGLLLRIAVQSGRSFGGDELGSLAYLKHDAGYLLTHFEGSLTMNWYLVLLKGLRGLFGPSTWVLVAPSLLAGLATIYLMHALARRLFDARSALLAAALIALSPTFVASSVGLRSYALFNAFALAAFLAALAWLESRRTSTGALCALAAVLALLAHPNALLPLLFVGVWVLLDLRHDRRRLAALAGPMALGALVVFAAYAPLRADIRAFRGEWTVSPPAEWDYLPELVRSYFGKNWHAVPALVLLGLGAWSAIRERSPHARLVLGILVPFCAASLLGFSAVSSSYPRFLSAVLPMALLLVVRGAGFLGTRWAPARYAGLALLLPGWLPQLTGRLEAPEERRLPELVAFLAQSEPADVIVIGQSIERYLNSETVRESRGALAAWKRRSAVAPERDLVVVCSGRPLRTEASRHEFGNLQLVRYTGPDRASRLRSLRADLLETLAGTPIDADLADHYGALMTVAESLGDERELWRYTIYYYECFLRTKRLRDVPDKLLSVRTTMSGNDLVKEIMEATTPAARMER
jgi:hypothetical protein